MLSIPLLCIYINHRNGKSQIIEAPLTDFQRYINDLQLLGSEPLAERLWAHIAPYLGLMYRLSALAREKLANIKAHKVLESDSRIKWDVLVLFLLRSDKDPDTNICVTSG